jgi:hypothetical protein
MPDSFYRTILIRGKAEKLQELADLASKDRTPAKAKQYAAEAAAILHDLSVLEDKIASTVEGPTGLDYRDDTEIYVAIVRFLSEVKMPVSEKEIIEELIRGQYPGYRDKHSFPIRVGRSIRSYVVGNPKVNPKLIVKNHLVGLPEWSDKIFS